MSDHDRIPLTISYNIKETSDKKIGKHQIIGRLLVDSISNSQTQHHDNFMADCKENYYEV